MACEGGCVQGAGCLVRSPKNRLDVERHAKQAEGRTILDTVHSNGKQEQTSDEEAPAVTKAKK